MIYNRGMTLALKNKKVLLLGLGSLGGGVATARWLLDLGCHVTITDLKDEKALAHSVRAVEEHLKRRARDGKHFAKLKSMLAWRLGGHSNDMIDEADLGDEDAEFTVGDAQDHSLAWYATQELPFLLELL